MCRLLAPFAVLAGALLLGGLPAHAQQADTTAADTVATDTLAADSRAADLLSDNSTAPGRTRARRAARAAAEEWLALIDRKD